MPDQSALIIHDAKAQLSADANTAPYSLWIDSIVLAKLAGIARQNAHAALVRGNEKKPWRGSLLEVRTSGNSTNLECYVPSLPAELRAKWIALHQPAPAPASPTINPHPSPPTSYAEDAGKRFAELRWKLNLLAPALDHPPRSHARGAALRQIAGKATTRPDGKTIYPKLSTLNEWLRKLEMEGERALTRKRQPKGLRRVSISRAWDTACPLSEEAKKQIRQALEVHIKTEWAAGVPGVNRVRQFASSKLVELSRSAGWDAATLKNCEVGRYLAEQYREYAIVAEKERNAKKFADTRLPRIKINRKHLKPGDVVIGDVHPFDVAKEENGRQVHARLISWLDLATYDIFVTVVILGEGRGIRQEDIAASFVDMVMAWGLPKQLRLDNGSEYKWGAMMQGFNSLAGLVRDFGLLFLPTLTTHDENSGLVDSASFTPRHTVSRARPYNAAAKQIEGVFGILEYNFFALMPGWIGGDRMNKRTHKVGETPAAHAGEDEEFMRDVEICLNLYRNTPQRDGTSPNDKRRTAYAAGYCPARVDREVFIFAFSEITRYTVHASGINVDGQWGICDALIPLIGQRVEIRSVKWDRSHTYYHAPDGLLHAIPMGQTYDHDDTAGAKEQGRRTKVLNAHIRKLKEQTKPLNMMDEAARHLAHMPPAPALPDGPTIRTAESIAIGKARNNAADPPRLKLNPGEIFDKKTGLVIKPEGQPPAPKVPAPLPNLIPSYTAAPAIPAGFDPIKNLTIKAA